MRRLLFILLSAVMMLGAEAEAAPSAKVVDSSELLSTRISYKLGTATKNKIIYCLGRMPGDAKGISDGVLFTPIATTIAKLKSRNINGAPFKRQQAIKKAGVSACARLSDGGSAPATPTPTPVGSSGNFDSNGNVTAKGKTTFGIPSSLSGNISAGKTLTANYCGCHGERTGRSFSYLRAAIAQPPMYFNSSQITDATLANITAYLNRFRP